MGWSRYFLGLLRKLKLAHGTRGVAAEELGGARRQLGDFGGYGVQLLRVVVIHGFRGLGEFLCADDQ